MSYVLDVSGSASGPIAGAAAIYAAVHGPQEQVTTGDRTAVLHRHSLGSVALPSGELAACDPFTGASVAFSRRVAAGTYPVELCVAEFADNGDQRVAAALLRLSDERPRTWELAVWPGQDSAHLDEDSFYGYPVDAGVGCFASLASLSKLGAILTEHFQGADDEADPLSAAMERTYVHTWDWANFEVDSGMTVFAFHSGYGDGIYPTFWGLGSADEPVCALTDFLVLDLTASDLATG